MRKVGKEFVDIPSVGAENDGEGTQQVVRPIGQNHSMA